ncbi:hypothetical protein EU528_14050 [Candidatus Thorarchaeota archaeon]|nr:MAG: hypothetical protein EU528_14050 [Candidatus Thorarchaeota archaeon]
MKHLRIVTTVIATLFLLTMVFTTTPVQVAAAADSEIIVGTGNISNYIWSSDGTRIAYVTYVDGESWGDLWICDWNGYEVTNHQLLFSEIEVNGLLDWQNNWILLRIRHENDVPEEYYGRGELWKISDNGTELTQITFTYTNGIRTEWWNTAYTNRGTAGWGRFIPGTDLVYFSAHDGNGWWQAHTCKADGTDQWKLISKSSYSFTIGMSPTGNKLVWGTSWYWDEPTTLMSSNVDGTGTVTMKELSFKTSPLVLADGDTVMFNRPDGDIGAIQVDGTDDRVVLNDEYSNYLVNYNPVDGNSFLMRSDRSSDGNDHIYSVDVDGTTIIQLTEGFYNDYNAMYSPDGHSLLYKRLPVNGTSYELIITWVGKQVEDLQSASIKMLFVGDLPGNNIDATITIGFYSNGAHLGVGSHQELINISSESGSVRPVGLGYDEMREHVFFTTFDESEGSDTLEYDVVSHRNYAAWTESERFGTWNGPLSNQTIADSIFWGGIIQFENLTVYFEDGSTFVCNSHLITLSAVFTKTDGVWDSAVFITTSDSEGISIDNRVVTISIRYPVVVSPVFLITIITITAAIGVVAGVVYLRSVRAKPEYHDEYVVYY